MGFDMNAFSLAGKKAIVTGGAKKTGLCYGMAVALHDAGAEIVILDANSQAVSYTHLTLPTNSRV